MIPAMANSRGLDSAPGAVAAFVALAAGLSLPGLGSLGLVRMEGMIAAIAGEMLRSGDWLVPRLYGEVYAYKPPLYYWLVAAGQGITGSSAEWTVRLPAALSGVLLGLAALVVVGRIAGWRRGLVAAVAAVTGALCLQKLRIAEFDLLLAALVGVAIAAAGFALASDDARAAGRAWWICFPALAAGILAKGAPALLWFVPGLLVAVVWTGRSRSLARPGHVAALLVSGALVASYIWLAYAEAGGEVFRQPLEEARLRGADWSWRAAGRTLVKPLWIWVYFLPWSVALFWGRPERQPDRTAADRLLTAAWGFLVAGTLVAMAVPTHESRYYLPLAVPVGIVASFGLARMAKSRSRLARSLPTGALLAVALLFWAAETFAFAPARAARRDQRAPAEELARSLGAGETVWVLSPAGLAGNYSGLLHYLGRPVRTFDGAAGPPPGALCVLREIDLERVAAPVRERLAPVASARGPRWTYHLYRFE